MKIIINISWNCCRCKSIYARMIHYISILHSTHNIIYNILNYPHQPIYKIILLFKDLCFFVWPMVICFLCSCLSNTNFHCNVSIRNVINSYCKPCLQRISSSKSPISYKKGKIYSHFRLEAFYNNIPVFIMTLNCLIGEYINRRGGEWCAYYNLKFIMHVELRLGISHCICIWSNNLSLSFYQINVT